MHQIANYIKHFLFFICLCAGLKGIAQNKTVDTTLTDTAIHKELNYKGDTIRNFSTRGFIRFHDTVNFSDATFLKDADFESATFLKDAVFSHTKFLKDADFLDASFAKDADFSNARFSEDADFSADSKFSKDAKFFGATFSKRAGFFEATFSKRADFRFVTFSKKLFFNYIIISDSTEFYFDRANFPDTIDFSNNSKIYNEIDFTTADFTDSSRYDYKTHTVKPIWIYLNKTDISKLHLDYIHFKLLLPDTTIDDFFKRIISNDEKEGMYEALLNNFKIHGQEESYDLLNKEFQEWKISQLSLIDRLWSIYFLKASNVFRITILTFLFFASINIFYYRQLNNKIYSIEHFSSETFLTKNNFLALLLGNFFNSLIYTGIIFFGFSLNFDKMHFKDKALLAWFLTIYITGLLILFLLTHLLFK